MPEKDRLEVLEEQLRQDGFAPETLNALELVLEELYYLRNEVELCQRKK